MNWKLGDLKVGQTAKIVGCDTGRRAYRHRLLSMGLTRATALRLAGVAPPGDPMRIRVRGHELSLRRDEARVLILEQASSADAV